MNYETLVLDVDEGVLTVTPSRPEQLNAFTVKMADELVEVFDRASDDDTVRAIIVTGAGRAFCAGMDLTSGGNVFGLDESLSPGLGDMRQRLHDPEISSGVRDTGGKVTLAIFGCKKPVIAAINGPAVGIGATMTLAMDARLGHAAQGSALSSAELGSRRRRVQVGSCPALSEFRRRWSGCTAQRSSLRKRRSAVASFATWCRATVFSPMPWPWPADGPWGVHR